MPGVVERAVLRSQGEAAKYGKNVHLLLELVRQLLLLRQSVPGILMLYVPFGIDSLAPFIFVVFSFFFRITFFCWSSVRVGSSYPRMMSFVPSNLWIFYYVLVHLREPCVRLAPRAVGLRVPCLLPAFRRLLVAHRPSRRATHLTHAVVCPFGSACLGRCSATYLVHD